MSAVEPPKLTWKAVAALALLFVVLGLAHTWPMGQRITRDIPYGYSVVPGYETAPMIPGDHLQFYYWCWLAGDNLLGPSDFPSNPYEFNTDVTPEGLAVYANFPWSLIFVAFEPLGPALAYNVMVLLTYVLVGLFTFLWARKIMGAWLAALPAAILMTLMPFRAAQALSGHIYGFVIFLLPLALWCLECGWRARPKQAELWGLGSGLALLAASVMENHLIYYSCLLLGLYVPLRVLQDGHRPALDNGQWSRVWAVVPLLAGFALGLTVHLSMFRGGGFELMSAQLVQTLAIYTLTTAGVWLLLAQLATELTSLGRGGAADALAKGFAPLVFSPLYAVQFFFDVPHLGAALLGLLLLAGAALALPPLWRARSLPSLSSGWWRPLWPMAICLVAAVAFLLHMKSTLMAGSIVDKGRSIREVLLFSPRPSDLFHTQGVHSEQMIYMGAVFMILALLGVAWLVLRRRDGDSVAARASLGAGLGLLALLLALGPTVKELPLYDLLYKYLPFFKYPRVPGRLIMVAAPLLGLAAGWALMRVCGMLRTGPMGKTAFGLATCALLALSVWPPQAPGMCPLSPPGKVEAAIVKDMPTGPGAGKRLLGLPIWPGDSHQSSIYEMLITRTRAVMVNGYAPYVPHAYLEQVFEPLYPLDFGQVTPQARQTLVRLNVGGIVFYDDDQVYTRKVSPYPPALARRRLEASGLLKPLSQEGSAFFYGLTGADRQNDTDGLVSPVVSLWEANWLGRDTGTLIDDINASGWGLLFREGPDPLGPLGPRMAWAKGNVAVARAGEDKPGFLSHGPHKNFPPGKYVARFRLKRGPGGEPGRLEIATGGGKTVLASRELPPEALPADGRWHDVGVPFEIGSMAPLEFRTWFSGQADLALDVVLVAFAQAHPWRGVYPAWRLWRQTGDLVADSQAPGGWAVQARPGWTPPLYLMHGPQQTYHPGRYRAEFIVRAADEPGPEGPACLLAVATDLGRRVLGSRSLENSELGPDYKRYAVEFRLKRRCEVGLRVKLHQGAALRLAGVQIIPLD